MFGLHAAVRRFLSFILISGFLILQHKPFYLEPFLGFVAVAFLPFYSRIPFCHRDVSINFFFSLTENLDKVKDADPDTASARGNKLARLVY